MKKRKDSPETAAKKDMLKIGFCGIVVVLLVIMEVYAMLHFNIIVDIVIAILIAADVFFLISLALDLSQRNKQMERKEYEDLYKAQKASYLVIRKSFDELQDRIDMLEAKTSIPADEIITAQKAVAKVTISRSKENTDALMNSNDELINHLFTFEEKIDTNNKELIEQQEKLLNATREEILARNKELEDKVNSLSASLDSIQANGISVASNENAVKPQEIEENITLDDGNGVNEEIDISDMPDLESLLNEVSELEEVASEMDLTDPVELEVEGMQEENEFAAQDTEKEISVQEREAEEINEIETEVEELNAESEEPEVEPEVETNKEDTFVGIDTSDPNKPMSPEDIAALLAAAGGEETNEAEPEVEEPKAETEAEEISVDSESIEPSAEQEEVEPIDELEAETNKEDPFAGIDTSDPNKPMSPEDIAALLAAAGGEETNEAEPELEEPNVEPEAELEENNAEPEIAAEPIPETTEEASQDPLASLENSDPNKMMSPEEIQALFANL